MGKSHWAWWHTPVITALKKPRQEDYKFQTNLGYIVRPCLRKQNKRTIAKKSPQLPSCLFLVRKDWTSF
jgi:hypothetical protein